MYVNKRDKHVLSLKRKEIMKIANFAFFMA